MKRIIDFILRKRIIVYEVEYQGFWTKQKAIKYNSVMTERELKKLKKDKTMEILSVKEVKDELL